MTVLSQSEAGLARDSGAVTAVRAVVGAAPAGPWLLSVSGGRDSMVLLDAVDATRPTDVAAVACFDHGTGAFSRRAVALVEREAASRGFPFVTGKLESRARQAKTEAVWREARWRFLHGWGRELGAVILTAHTRDDQAETVALRILRGAGARGLAAMASGTSRGVARPLLVVSRAQVTSYAHVRALPFLDDPSNEDRRHARNRVRHDLLPMLEHARPGFTDWLLDLSDRAADWRGQVERLVEQLREQDIVRFPERGVAVVRTDGIGGLGAEGWGVLWPAIAARAGIAMDRRGITRASEWASRASVSASGGVIQLAGGAEIERPRRGRTLVLRCRTDGPSASMAPGTT